MPIDEEHPAQSDHGVEIPHASQVNNSPRRSAATVGVAIGLVLAGGALAVAILRDPGRASQGQNSSDATQRTELQDGWRTLGALAAEQARMDEGARSGTQPAPSTGSANSVSAPAAAQPNHGPMESQRDEPNSSSVLASPGALQLAAPTAPVDQTAAMGGRGPTFANGTPSASSTSAASNGAGVQPNAGLPTGVTATSPGTVPLPVGIVAASQPNSALPTPNTALPTSTTGVAPSAAASSGGANGQTNAVPSQGGASSAGSAALPSGMVQSPDSALCGRNTCNSGTVCCNESCGTCVAPGASCDATPCSNPITFPASQLCGMTTCNVGSVCCNSSCGICTEPGATCSQTACS